MPGATCTRITPRNTGGGRHPVVASATLYPSGQLTLTAAAVSMLGQPQSARVTLDVDDVRGHVYISPGTDIAGSFSLSGGGNTPARIGCRQVARDYPALVGKYSVHAVDGGIELRKL